MASWLAAVVIHQITPLRNRSLNPAETINKARQIECAAHEPNIERPITAKTAILGLR